MKTDTEVLIKDLIDRTQQNLTIAEKLAQEPVEILNWREQAGSWSILECLEHLNLYGDFYLPEIENKIQASRYKKPDAIFKSGLLGNYFAEMMLPNAQLKKMKTLKDKDPIGSKLGKETIQRFIEQQKGCLNLLESARAVNLNRTKTGISITKLIKLKLGDIFRVLIYHNQRHVVQAERILAAQGTEELAQ